MVNICSLQKSNLSIKKITKALNAKYTVVADSDERLYCQRNATIRLEEFRGTPILTDKNDFETIFNLFLARKMNNRNRTGSMKGNKVHKLKVGSDEEVEVEVVEVSLIQKNGKVKISYQLHYHL